MLPDLPHLKRDVQKVIDRYLRLQVNARLGAFAETPKHVMREGNRMRIIRADGSVHESELKEISAQMSVKMEEIPTLTVKERIVKLDNMAEQMASQMSSHVFGTLNEVLNKAGRGIDQKGKPLDAEAVFNALENMDIEFDEGGHKQLSMIVPPGLAPKAIEVMAEIDSDPALRRRHEEIMIKKWMEWRGREASRKLVG